MRKPVELNTGPRAVAYYRVSTKDQELDQQKHAVASYAEKNGLEIVAAFEDYKSGKSFERAGWKQARAMLKAGDADALIVAKLDRLSRSVADFALLLQESRKEGWRLIFCDYQVDTSTPIGEFTAHLSAGFAQMERAAISDRVKRGIAQKKREGHVFGAKPKFTPEQLDVIRSMWVTGFNVPQIARYLGVYHQRVYLAVKRLELPPQEVQL